MSEERIGERVGIFELVELIPEKSNDGHIIYKGVCQECGFERIARYSDLKRTTICTHNYTNWSNKRIGKIFRDMKRRCYEKDNDSYRWYGAKNIRIYDEWLNNPKTFEIWALNNGYSDELTIDRKDEDLDYCPENCRWVSHTYNSKYKSTTSMIQVGDICHTGREWADVLGLGTNVINTYIRKYGIDNTIEFIKKRLENPTLKPIRTQSYYDLYMSNN